MSAAAEELGLVLRDKVAAYRVRNLDAMAANASKKLQSVLDNIHAHPLVVSKIVEQASWTDDAVVQDLWAGLLVSSCTEEGDDDSNLIFVVRVDEIFKISEVADINRIDSEFTPTPLALNMYVRCQGSRKPPVEFFGVNVN